MAFSYRLFKIDGRLMGDDTDRRELIVPFDAGAYVLRYRIHRDTINKSALGGLREYRGDFVRRRPRKVPVLEKAGVEVIDRLDRRPENLRPEILKARALTQV